MKLSEIVATTLISTLKIENRKTCFSKLESGSKSSQLSEGIATKLTSRKNSETIIQKSKSGKKSEKNEIRIRIEKESKLNKKVATTLI